MHPSLIDSHIHFSSHERLEEMQRYRREVGVETLCLLSLPVTARINFNPEVLYAKIRLGSDCYGLASFDYGPLLHAGSRDEPGEGAARAELDLPGQVDRFRELGFDGLKIFLGKPSFQSLVGLKLNDPELLAAFKRAEQLQMPVLIHIADPLVFWSYESIPGFIPPGWEQALSEGGGGIPPYEDLQAQALDVLRVCPDLTVIFPHLLSMAQDVPRLAKLLETYPGAYLDLAPGLYFYYELHRQREEARQFFHRYADRILFGTDAFWFPRWFSEFAYATVEDNVKRARLLLRFLESDELLDNPFQPTRGIQPRVRGLALQPEVVTQLLSRTFRRIYPPESRSVDPESVLAYVDDFSERLRELGRDGEQLDPVHRLRAELAAPGEGGS